MTLVLLQAALLKNEELLKASTTVVKSMELIAQRCTIYQLMNDLLLEQLAAQQQTKAA